MPDKMTQPGYSLPRPPSFGWCNRVAEWSMTNGLNWITPILPGLTAIVRNVGRAEADQGWQDLTNSMNKRSGHARRR